ncbi:MAG: hypothetical protein K1060chlam5_01211 [Candidatus Anoxychlamydiales bacterium]|nr:hypothetical protein [Candidatus Anoxychlamydiales bacterium]
MIIYIKVILKSKKNAIISFDNNILKIKLKAIAEKGKANIELIKFLSKTFSIPKYKISILNGKKSHLKKIKIDSLTKDPITNYFLK